MYALELQSTLNRAAWCDPFHADTHSIKCDLCRIDFHMHMDEISAPTVSISMIRA